MNAPTSAPALAAISHAERSARQAAVVAALAPLLPAHALLWHGEDTVPYECDGLTAYRQLPLLVFCWLSSQACALLVCGCGGIAYVGALMGMPVGLLIGGFITVGAPYLLTMINSQPQ